MQYYTYTTLRDIGLRLPLGHGGGTCPNKSPALLAAVTVDGIKSVGVYFCRCANADSDEEQIKQHGWWPLGSNFVSALTLQVINTILGPEEGANDDDSESDGEDGPADTDSSTSE